MDRGINFRGPVSMGPDQTPPTEDQPVKVRTLNDQLMRDMGSKNGGDPLPPSNYMYFIDKIKCSPNVHRVVAWLRWKCVRYRKLPDGSTAVEGRRPDGRCHYAIDETGKALGIADMARDLGWDVSNATRYWKEAESHGLCRQEARFRLCLEGDVRSLKKETNGAVGTREQELCTYHLDKPSVVKARDFSETEYAEFLNLWKLADEHEQAWIAADIAEIRAKMGRVKDAIKRHKNLPVRRLEVERKPVPAMPQMLLDFVQTTGDSQCVQSGVQTEAVHSENGNAQTSNHRSVPEAPSLLYSEPSNRTLTAAAALSREVGSISEALEIDAAAAASIFKETRKAEPSITTEEIIELGRDKLAQIKPQRIKGTVTSWVGILKTYIPQMAAGGPLIAARRAIRERREQEAYQRLISEAAAQTMTEAAADETPARRAAREKQDRDQAEIAEEKTKEVSQELARRKSAEDRKYYMTILANPAKMVGNQRFWTDEQIEEAQQWKRENPEEKIRTAGGGDI
jgi:hypothetical protein